jgi:hypothetical protein
MAKSIQQREAEMRLVSKYSNDILEIVDGRDEYDRGDLEGVAMAVVLNIIHEIRA